MAREYPALLDLIGRTPVVRLQQIGRELGPTLLVKLEYLNPGGSNKDRIGLKIIADAERHGKLRRGGTIGEPTPGNSRARLALPAATKRQRRSFARPDHDAPHEMRPPPA